MMSRKKTPPSYGDPFKFFDYHAIVIIIIIIISNHY
jgi:hypothetical protein